MADSKSKELKRLAEIERGDSASLRVSVDQFVDQDGQPHDYVSLRLWFKNDEGSWLPTKKGLTVRKGEIREVGKALRAALDILEGPDGPPKPAQPRTSQPRRGERRMEAQPPRNPNYNMDEDAADAYF